MQVSYLCAVQCKNQELSFMWKFLKPMCSGMLENRAAGLSAGDNIAWMYRFSSDVPAVKRLPFCKIGTNKLEGAPEKG